MHVRACVCAGIIVAPNEINFVRGNDDTSTHARTYMHARTLTHNGSERERESEGAFT